MLEDKIQELENIVAALENQTISLEDGIKLFEKGVAVTKECLDGLNESKGKITAIKKQMNELIEKPLDID